MSKKRKIIICLLIAAILIVAAAWLLIQPRAKELTTAAKGPMSETFTETAELRARENVTFYANGQTIATVHVQTGQNVAAGDILLTYKSAHDQQLASLQAERQAALTQYDALQSDAQLRLADASRLLASAQQQYDRQQKLYQAGALSQKEWEDAADALEALRSQRASAQQALTAAQSQKQAQLAQIDASLALTAVQSDDAIITAPFDGIITDCPATAGAALPMGTPLLELQNPAALYLQVDLLTEDAARITDQTTVCAVNADYSLRLEGLPVTFIAPKARDTVSTLGVTQKRLPVEIVLPPEAAAAPLASEWDAAFILSTCPDALWLPKACVYTRDGQSYVLLPDGKTEQRVTTGIREDDRVQITDGLSPGDQVAVPE